MGSFTRLTLFFFRKESSVSETRETPLASWHRDHGAKMAPFAGWDMPIQYEGILAEHNHTRNAASVFDICHMGQFMLEGGGAAEKLARAVTHNLATLKEGKCRYGFLLNEKGGVLDDLIIYRLGRTGSSWWSTQPAPRAISPRSPRVCRAW